MQQPVNWMPPMKSWLSATTNNRASLTTVLTTPPCKSKSYRASRVLWLGGNFVAGATISWKLLRVVVDWGEVAVVCLSVCYTTLRPAAAAWLESQVWTTEPKTVTPGSCQAFSPIFQLFRSCWYFFGAADTFQRQHPIQHILPPVIWILGGRFEDTVMAYRVIRMKKEARRNTKLDEIFQVTIVSKYSRYPLFQNIQGTFFRNIQGTLFSKYSYSRYPFLKVPFVSKYSRSPLFWNIPGTLFSVSKYSKPLCFKIFKAWSEIFCVPFGWKCFSSYCFRILSCSLCLKYSM